jgi:hypothetical protein
MEQRESIFTIVNSRGLLYESIFYAMLVFFCLITVALVGWLAMLGSPHGVLPALWLGVLGWFIHERSLTAATWTMTLFYGCIIVLNWTSIAIPMSLPLSIISGVLTAGGGWLLAKNHL